MIEFLLRKYTYFMFKRYEQSTENIKEIIIYSFTTILVLEAFTIADLIFIFLFWLFSISEPDIFWTIIIQVFPVILYMMFIGVLEIMRLKFNLTNKE